MQFIENAVYGQQALEKISRWQSCSLCDLCKTRTQTVLWRGYLPCRVLFIGEGPGAFEDLKGFPFIGPAGNKLNEIIEATIEELAEDEQEPLFTYAITNLVCCIPKKGKETREPTKEEIQACSTRLQEFVDLAQPSLIVRLGKLAQTNFKTKIPTVDIVHPSAILKADKSEQGPMFYKAVSQLFNAVKRSRD